MCGKKTGSAKKGSGVNPVSGVILFCALIVSGSFGQNFIAVLDLVSDGSVSPKVVREISDRISESIASEDPSYMPFEREYIPELLKQFAVDQSATACSDPQCLTLMGSMIGATTVVGGSISRSKGETFIELNLVDVAQKRALNSVSFSSKAKKSVLLQSEIPALASSLLSPDSRVAKRKPGKKRGFFRNPVTYIGTALVGGAAFGAYYYMSNNGGPDGKESTEEIPISDAPVRSRSE